MHFSLFPSENFSIFEFHPYQSVLVFGAKKKVLLLPIIQYSLLLPGLSSPLNMVDKGLGFFNPRSQLNSTAVTYCPMQLINTMLCPIKVNSNTIDFIMHISCYCILDLLCVKAGFRGFQITGVQNLVPHCNEQWLGFRPTTWNQIQQLSVMEPKEHPLPLWLNLNVQSNPKKLSFYWSCYFIFEVA